MIPKTVQLNGYFKDQQGTATRGKITGYNGNGVPCRVYTWTDPVIPELKGKKFQAYDDQIKKAMI